MVAQVHQINKYQEREGYIPTKLQYEDVTYETNGYFSLGDQVSTAESTEYLDSCIESFLEMENLIKKNFMMPPDKSKLGN